MGLPHIILRLDDPEASPDDKVPGGVAGDMGGLPNSRDDGRGRFTAEVQLRAWFVRFRRTSAVKSGKDLGSRVRWAWTSPPATRCAHKAAHTKPQTQSRAYKEGRRRVASSLLPFSW